MGVFDAINKNLYLVKRDDLEFSKNSYFVFLDAPL